MLASSNVSISVLANSFLKHETAAENVRRNYLVLFDSAQQESAKLDVSLGVSIVDREKEKILRDRVENVHPAISGAKRGVEDKKELNMQKFR